MRNILFFLFVVIVLRVACQTNGKEAAPIQYSTEYTIPGNLYPSLIPSLRPQPVGWTPEVLFAGSSIRLTTKKWFPDRWIFRPPMEYG